MKAGELLQLKAFLEVAQTGSFARAAQQLGLTASAVSQSVKQLEKGVGIKLFNRTTRRVAITEAGETMLLAVSPALQRLDDAYETLNKFRVSPRGQLRLTISHVAAEQLIAPLLPDFYALYPDLELDVSIDDKMIDLATHRMDAGIRRGELLDESMIVRRISREDRLVLVASPSHLAKYPALNDPTNLRNQPCIRIRLLSSGTVPPWRFTKDGSSMVIVPRGPLTVNDAGIARDMAIAGLGVARLAKLYVKSAVDAGRLCIVLPDWASPLSAFFLYYSTESRISVPLQALRDFLVIRI